MTKKLSSLLDNIHVLLKLTCYITKRLTHTVLPVVSVLPVLSKVIERHVHDSLYSCLCVNNLIYYKQSGFRKRHSTETALIGIIDELLFNLDSDRASGMILIDYCKAFDMVDHSVLLQELQAYRLDNKSLIWFRSYLNERR